MKDITTRELLNQLQSRLIIDLKENEILCPKCKGLRFILTGNKDSSYIESCVHCHTGKMYVCKYCGEATNTDHCKCEQATKEREEVFIKEQVQKESIAFKNAEKINYKDYKGYFILEGEEHIKESDDLEQWIYEKLENGDEVPEYLWAVEGSPCVSVDLLDIISEQCEDEYEDMYAYLDTDSELLSEAQELINQWSKKQGDSLCTFSETYKKAVIIKELVEEIKKNLSIKD